jgi:hypothetical protein
VEFLVWLCGGHVFIVYSSIAKWTARMKSLSWTAEIHPTEAIGGDSFDTTGILLCYHIFSLIPCTREKKIVLKPSLFSDPCRANW